MKRRAFLQLLAATNALAAPRAAKRITRLYREAPISQQIRMIPDILALGDKIVALRLNQPVLTASKPDGAFLWEHSLAQAQFATIAGVAGGDMLMQSPGSKLRRLNPQDGSSTPIKGGDNTVGRLFYAGDGYLIRPAGFQIELWKLNGESLELVHHTAADVPAAATVDLLSPALAAITASDATAMWTVEIPSGRVHRFKPDSVAPQSPLMVTGVDRERGRLLWLFTPREIAQPVQVVAIDSEGNVEPAGAFERHGRFPIRVMKYGEEIGIAYADGLVSWH